MTINTPGVYDITAEEYHADPCPEPSLSNSIAKILVSQTPRHAWQAHVRLNPAFEPEEESKFNLGKAGHSLMLGDPQDFEIVDASDWRTKDAKQARDNATLAGRIPILKDQWVRTQMMVRSARSQLAAHEDAADAFTDGQPEKTLIWKEGPVWCRARLDWLPNNPKKHRVFDDYKTTAASAGPDEWSRVVYGCDFDMQSAFYRRGIKALGLCNDPLFRYIVQENYEPFALCAIALTPAAVDLAEHKVARALDIWGTCLKANVWPGYPNRTCYIDPPAWHEAQFLARDERAADVLHQSAHRPDPETLKRSMEAQAPL